MLHTVFELSLVNAAVEVFVAALSVDVATVELARVRALADHDVGATALD